MRCFAEIDRREDLSRAKKENAGRPQGPAHLWVKVNP